MPTICWGLVVVLLLVAGVFAWLAAVAIADAWRAPIRDDLDEEKV